MFFGYSVRSPHRTTKPSRGWVRVGVRKPRLVLSEYRATRSKVTATPRSYCRGCGFLLHNSSSSLPWAWGNKAPASRTRTRLANATTNSPHSRPLHVGAAREQNELIVVDPRARGGGVAQAAAVTTEGQPDAPPRAKTKTRRRHDDLPHAAVCRSQLLGNLARFDQPAMPRAHS